MTRITMRAMVTALALASVLAIAGCASKPAVVISAWPVAHAERTITPPPEPPRWPLTGLVAPDRASTRMRPLSIKVENSPEARPQTGLNSADVVYETVVEGGITRFHLIFQSVIPKIVGPVRSARLSDLWVVPQYHGVFYYSGASNSVTARVSQAGLPDLSEDAGTTYPYFRSAARPAPHNLYITMSKAFEEARRHKFDMSVSVPKLEFGTASATTSSATAVKSVYVPLSSFNNVTWTYDKKHDVFLRQNNHVIQVDAASGKRLAAKNIVVMWAKYTPASHDKVGSVTWDIRLGGRGRATVFRNGRRYNATWVATRTQPPHFVDKNGRPIRLARGNTWFEVVPLDVNISMK